jgi:hypothetical protein
MTRPLLSNARRRLRRPSRATIVAFVVLSLLMAAVVAPPAGFAQGIDPLAAVDQSMDGGGVPVPMDVEAGIEDAIEAGGVPAVLESPQEPTPPPAPVSEPQSDVLDVPDSGMPSETAPEPAPESQPTDSVVEDSAPAAPAAPINLNVDIRILSPGDNGDVTQETTLPGGSPPGRSGPVGGGAQGQPLDWTWNWTWIWITPEADDIEEAGEELLGEVLGTSPGDPEGFFADAPVDQPVAVQPQQSAGPAAETGHAPSRRHDAAALSRGGPNQPAFGLSDAGPLPTVVGSSGGATSVLTEADRARLAGHKPDTGHAPVPKQAPPALPAAAASSVGGGSSAPLAAALIGLLCLLAPRALELARARPRTLSSQLSSSRLERPG